MKLIDITHPLSPQTPVLPGVAALALEKVKALEEIGIHSYRLASTLHTGTHIDMPMHLVDDDRMAADFPIDCFAGRGVLLDVRGQNPIVMDVRYADMVREGDAVLLYTGFDAQYETDTYFDAHPVVEQALADFLVARKVKLVGMDLPAPDVVPYAIHKALLGNGIFVLENLTNLSALLEVPDFEVMALPLKLAAEASFVRAVCRVES